tara:strand:- start:1483 stop:1992 length:510 start_codon:yes stop_codon:yes gene_type:complete
MRRFTAMLCSAGGDALQQRALAGWARKHLAWNADLARRVAETAPAATVRAFDSERATTTCDVLKVRYKLRQKDVGDLVSHHPALLGYSLEHQILPALNVLDKTLRLPESLRSRLLLRVPRLLANEFDPLRDELRVALQRICHLNKQELSEVMAKLPSSGELLTSSRGRL